jgi:PD-(D/E)XK nuclease superfamily protein
VIIEINAVERLMPVHEAQMLTYMKLSGIRTGLLLNFNSAVLKDGIRRLILRSRNDQLLALSPSRRLIVDLRLHPIRDLPRQVMNEP